MELNKKTPDSSTLAGRLAACVEKAGGKRSLAAASVISEAQLFRYLNGLSDIPSERIITIAKAAGVNPGWLLTGDEIAREAAQANPRPPFRPELMQFTARMLDEFLVEYQRTFSPRLKSQILTLMYEALRHEEILEKKEVFPNKFQMLCALTFMESLKTEEEMEIYHEAMSILEYKKSNLQNHVELLKMFCRLIVKGYENYYNSYTGNVYYDRMGTTVLLKKTEEKFKEWLELSFNLIGSSDLNLLDIGCGNGKHLNYMQQTFPKLKLHGVDISAQAIELCKKMESMEILPEGTAKVGDCTQLPYPNQSMNLIHCRNVLHYVPYLPDTGMGLEAAWKEIVRVLKPKGTVLMTVPLGEGRSYMQFTQLLTMEQLQELAEKNGLKIISHSIDDYVTSPNDEKTNACIPTQLKKSVTLILQKG